MSHSKRLGMSFDAGSELKYSRVIVFGRTVTCMVIDNCTILFPHLFGLFNRFIWKFEEEELGLNRGPYTQPRVRRIIKQLEKQTIIIMLHVVGKPLVLWSDLYNWAQFLVVKNNNDNNDRQSYLHVSDVLLYVPSFGASSSSASFKWTRILVFFWKFIGAARVDGRISKVKESARNSRAEPEGKKSLCGVKSFHLWYVIMPSYRLK